MQARPQRNRLALPLPAFLALARQRAVQPVLAQRFDDWLQPERHLGRLVRAALCTATACSLQLSHRSLHTADRLVPTLQEVPDLELLGARKIQQRQARASSWIAERTPAHLDEGVYVAQAGPRERHLELAEAWFSLFPQGLGAVEYLELSGDIPEHLPSRHY
jgi:hypothetical protein